MISSFSTEELTRLAKETGLMFFRKIKKKPNQILTFLSNYHEVIHRISEKNISKFINNLSLHFINLSSYALLEDNKKS